MLQRLALIIITCKKIPGTDLHSGQSRVVLYCLKKKKKKSGIYSNCVVKQNRRVGHDKRPDVCQKSLQKIPHRGFEWRSRYQNHRLSITHTWPLMWRHGVGGQPAGPKNVTTFGHCVNGNVRAAGVAAQKVNLHANTERQKSSKSMQRVSAALLGKTK